eukprot:16307216-Heterocapsa_arctica.AAC.1
MAMPADATTALLISATSALQEMSRRQEKFEDKVLHMMRPGVAPDAADDRADLRRLQGRLDSFEKVMMDGSCRNAATTGAGPALARGPQGGLEPVP